MTQLLQNAVYGTALILAAAALRLVLKGRLIPEARLALWAVCLFRLLTPAAPESALSLWGLSRLFQPRQTPAAPAPVTGTPQFYELPQTAPAPQPAPGIPWETVLMAVWLAVGLALAVRYVLSWTRTRRAVACAIPLDGRDPRYTFLPKCARLREGPMEGAPLTFGAVKPTVVLSPGLDGDALDCVLAHEGVHARRRDNLWHYAMALALVVHWWNPAVWLMARLLRRDIELSCDRAALRKLGEGRRADYANTLVTLATQGDGPAFCQTFGRKAAEERIVSVMKFKKTSVIGVVLSLALVLAVTAAFASEPKTDGGTVQFHGQAFQRDQLSQETLDWLDWYLALPEEQQLAVSYVPAELNRGRDTGTQDAYDSEKVAGSTTMTGLPDDVLAYARNLSVGMSRETVHALLGEPSFSSSSLFSDTYELDPGSFERQLGIYYEMDGTVCQVRYFSDGTDPGGTGIDLTPFLTASGEDQPTYQAISGYKMILPEIDESGVSRVYDDEGNLLVVGTPRTPFGTPLCDGLDCDIANPHIHHDGQVIYVDYQDPYTDPVPVPSAEPADDILAALHDTLRDQWEDRIHDQISEALLSRAGSTSCGLAECTETRYHAHNEGRTILLSDPCPVEGCTITGNHIHGDVCYSCNGAGHSGGVCDGSCYTYN